MEGVFDVPESETVVDVIAESLLHLGTIPVALPWQRILIHHAFHEDHLAFESAGLNGTRSGHHRTNQHGPLRFKRLAIRSTELVPNIEVRRRHLVPMVVLSCEE